MAKLAVIRGDDLVRLVELRDRDLRIGRNVDNDIVLPDQGRAVSRFHATLRFDRGRYVVADLASQNGIWVDGERVREAELAPGREVALGPYRLVFQDDDSSSAETRRE